MDVLCYDGADALLTERLGAFSFSFDIEIFTAPDEAGISLPRGGLALLSFPDEKGLLEPLAGAPFLACGPADCLDSAFAAGALDYLRDPWTVSELQVRAARCFAELGRNADSCGIRLCGNILSGPSGRISLGTEEAAVLRLLMEESPNRVSRAALRRFIWPRVGSDSRVVDEAVSRLRHRLIQASGAHASPQIRSVRGFGYVFTTDE